MGRAFRPAAAAAVLVMLGSFSIACGPREPLPAPEAYERYCARCHGDDGRGDPKAVRLNPGLDLVRSRMVAEGDRELVRQRIAEGRGAMPGFERKLVPGELEALTEYTIERFGDGMPAPPPRPRRSSAASNGGNPATVGSDTTDD